MYQLTTGDIMSGSHYGNKQVNVRMESELLDSIKEAAEDSGLSVQEWVRNACRSALGQSIPGAISSFELESLRGEVESAIAGLTAKIKKQSEEIEAIKKPVLAA